MSEYLQGYLFLKQYTKTLQSDASLIALHRSGMSITSAKRGKSRLPEAKFGQALYSLTGRLSNHRS